MQSGNTYQIVKKETVMLRIFDKYEIPILAIASAVAIGGIIKAISMLYHLN